MHVWLHPIEQNLDRRFTPFPMPAIYEYLIEHSVSPKPSKATRKPKSRGFWRGFARPYHGWPQGFVDSLVEYAAGMVADNIRCPLILLWSNALIITSISVELLPWNYSFEKYSKISKKTDQHFQWPLQQWCGSLLSSGFETCCSCGDYTKREPTYGIGGRETRSSWILSLNEK